jgi:outer membrane protein with beta-barrel domain
MKQHRLGFPLLSLSVALTFAVPALAQDRDDDDVDVQVRTRRTSEPEVRYNSPSGRFGLEGQKAVSSDAGLSISNTSVSGVDGSTTTLLLRPAVDWFFADSISIGGFVGVEYTSTPGGSSSAISVGPRVGYNLPVSERLSIWPKLGFSLANTTVSIDGIDDDETNTSVQLNLFAPLMFHPVQHFFLGFGPALDVDLSGDAKATTIAARLTLGGWL